MAASTVAALFGGGACLLHAEAQWQVVAVVAALGSILWFADRTAPGRSVLAACRAAPAFADLAAALAASFREDHYALLMIASAPTRSRTASTRRSPPACSAPRAASR